MTRFDKSDPFEHDETDDRYDDQSGPGIDFERLP